VCVGVGGAHRFDPSGSKETAKTDAPGSFIGTFDAASADPRGSREIVKPLTPDREPGTGVRIHQALKREPIFTLLSAFDFQMNVFCRSLDGFLTKKNLIITPE